MIEVSAAFKAAMMATPRTVRAALTIGGTTYSDHGALRSFRIDTAPQASGIIGTFAAARLAAVLQDPEGTLTIAAGEKAVLQVWPEDGPKSGEENEKITLPTFIIEDVSADTVAKTLTVTASDSTLRFAEHRFDELVLAYPLTYRELLQTVCGFAGVSLCAKTFTNEMTQLLAPPNLDGSESLRQVVAKVAEACFGIAVINGEDELQIKSLLGDPVAVIGSADYFSLDNVVGTTYDQLCLSRQPQGDDVYAVDIADGQTVLTLTDSPMIDYGKDDRRPDVIAALYAEVNGLTWHAYTMRWRDGLYLEPGDIVTLEAPDGTALRTVYGAAAVEFDGGMQTEVSLSPPEQQSGTEQKGTLHERLRQTTLAVDKARQEIRSLIEQKDDLTQQISEIRQQIDNVTISLSAAAYKNYLLNSCGQNDLQGWTTAGAVSTAATETISGSAIVLTSTETVTASVSQSVRLQNTDYCLSLRARGTTNSAGFSVFIVDVSDSTQKTELLSVTQLDTDAFSACSCTFVPPYAQCRILLSASAGSTVALSDMILSIGTQPAEWTQSDEELFTTSVKISEAGVDIGTDKTAMHSRITPSAFEIYRGTDKRISIAADGTRLQKTIIEDDMTVGTMKIFKRDEGADFVVL